MNLNLDSRKIGMSVATAAFVLLFVLPSVTSAAATQTRHAPVPYTGPLEVEIDCQIGPCGVTSIFIEPYLSADSPSTIVTPTLLVGAGGLFAAGEIDTFVFPGITTAYFPLSYSAFIVKNPYPNDFGTKGVLTIRVNTVGILEIGSQSFSADYGFTCQNLNGNLVFLNTHIDVRGTAESGTLTSAFAAAVSCVT